MIRLLRSVVTEGLRKPAPATGLGLFRLAFGLVALQEILFLFYFRHLIFDPIPYLDRASPILHFFLLIWAATALALSLGYHTRKAAFLHYCFWVLFVVFTPMWQDFDGGFDQLMTGSSFLLIFLPSERAFSLDRLRLKLRYSVPGRRYLPPDTVPVLAYTLTLAIALGLLYFDSGLHKLSAEFWRNGMGAWLPATHPYYVSPIDMSPLLNLESAERAIGYTIIAFQLSFIFLFWRRFWRVPLLGLGVVFHSGIILSLNVYPFGFGMLVHYLLLVPFAWWRKLGTSLRYRLPRLTVFFDEDCPLCNRTVIVIEHFDVFRAVAFKGLQTHARDYPELAAIPESELLADLYALDRKGRLYAGLDTYLRIAVASIYLAPLGWLLRLPGLYGLAARVYRRIADGRERLVCRDHCQPVAVPMPVDERPFPAWFARYAADERQVAQRITKFLALVLVLQLNSTIHYGVLYRWAGSRPSDPALAVLDHLSDTVINFSHAFLGISPHALYMHDHFAGYERILALTYRDALGEERWLPFVNSEGRLLTPYWGRIQSMWANVAITSHPSPERLEKFLRKLTAYFAVELGLPLEGAEFGLKLKRIEVPMDFQPDLRRRNMATPWRDVGKVEWRRDGLHIAVSDPIELFGASGPEEDPGRDRPTREPRLPLPGR